MSGCGSCQSCGGGGDKAREYKNEQGYSAVKCPLCAAEIILSEIPVNCKAECRHCGTEIEIIRMLLN